MHRSAARTVACLFLAVLALGAATAVAQNIPGAAARVNAVEVSNFWLEGHFGDRVLDPRAPAM